MGDDTVIEMQCGALPVRRHDGKVEVLMVTSRETRRWVIPKGWPVKGLSHAESAALEALEEAGIEGKVDSKPLGSFHYGKRFKNGSVQSCCVEVFRMEVRTEHDTWPESGERSRKWIEAGAAANLVAEPELAALIRQLS